MQRVGLSLILLLGTMAAFGPLATDMYLPAFPAVAEGLRATPDQVQKTLAAFFLGMGAGQLVYGALADRYGRRGPLFAGLALFALASAGAALAQEIGAFTLLRLLQGLGGCAGTVLSRAIARDLTEGPATVRLMSQLMLVMGVAPILAPSLGGLLLEVAGWRAIFWVLAAYGAGLMLAVAVLLPETLPPDRRRRDSFVDVLRLYLRLLADRRFLGLALAGALPLAGMFAYIGGSPFVYMDLNGVSPRFYAVLFGMNAAGLILMGQVNALLARRIAAARMLALVQGAMAAAGVALLVVTATGLGGFPAIVAGVFLFVACGGAVMPLSAALALAPMGRMAGSASAVMGTLQFGIGAVTGWLVGALHDGTALPMAAIIAGCGVAGVVARRALVREG